MQSCCWLWVPNVTTWTLIPKGDKERTHPWWKIRNGYFSPMETNYFMVLKICTHKKILDKVNLQEELCSSWKPQSPPLFSPRPGPFLGVFLPPRSWRGETERPDRLSTPYYLASLGSQRAWSKRHWVLPSEGVWWGFGGQDREWQNPGRCMGLSLSPDAPSVPLGVAIRPFLHVLPLPWPVVTSPNLDHRRYGCQWPSRGLWTHRGASYAQETSPFHHQTLGEPHLPSKNLAKSLSDDGTLS